MKDLITTIGAILILSIFILQFCSNQIIASKILMADSIVDGIGSFDNTNQEVTKAQLADCFDCDTKEITIDKKKDRLTIKVPIHNVIACGEFLGISGEENKGVYVREIALK